MALKLKTDEAQGTQGTADAATAETDAAKASAVAGPVGLDAGSSELSASARRSRTVFSILALVVAAGFIAVIVMQVLEYLYYGEPPSVWPVK